MSLTKTAATKTIRIDSPGSHTIVLEESGTYTIVLTAEGAVVRVDGRFAADGKQRIELKVILHHQAAHTRAETVLKGVARDQSVISFQGKIIIDEGCPDTQSFLTERILLLSDSARAEAIPDLEILSDDVSCSHAASITNIPQSQLFYLMSRGLSRASAEELIVNGFLQ